MNYHLRSKPKSENRPKIFLVLAVFVILFLLSYFFGAFFRKIFTNIAKPIWVVGITVEKPFSNITDYFRTRGALISENQNLKDQITALSLKVTDYNTVSTELSDLKNESGRNVAGRLVTNIISRPPQSPFDTLVIDFGSSDGITVDSKAYLSDTIIVGTVQSVSPRSSIVSLFSTPNKKTDVVLLRTGASYSLEGNGGGNFKLEVPKDTDIVWGDSFMYPGSRTSLVANVYYIDSNSQSSFKTIYLRVPGNVFSSKYLFVE